MKTYTIKADQENFNVEDRLIESTESSEVKEQLTVAQRKSEIKQLKESIEAQKILKANKIAELQKIKADLGLDIEVDVDK